MSAELDQRSVVGPLVIPFRGDQRAPSCTACGRTLTAVTFLGATTRDRDPLALCCDGCGRRGVFCECAPVDGRACLNGVRRA